MAAELDHSFLFQNDVRLQGTEHVEAGARSDPLSDGDGGGNTSGLLELRNADDESVYDLLTRSSVSVLIGHSYNWAAMRGDDDPLVEYCVAPSHQVGCEGKEEWPLSGLSGAPSLLCTRSLLKRLLLGAHPPFNPSLRLELNYRARRMALFLAFSAGTTSTTSQKRTINIFARLRRYSGCSRSALTRLWSYLCGVILVCSIGHGELFAAAVSYL